MPVYRHFVFVICQNMVTWFFAIFCDNWYNLPCIQLSSSPESDQECLCDACAPPPKICKKIIWAIVSKYIFDYYNLLSINIFGVTLELFCYMYNMDCRVMFLQRSSVKNRLHSFVNVYDMNTYAFWDSKKRDKFLKKYIPREDLFPRNFVPGDISFGLGHIPCDAKCSSSQIFIQYQTSYHPPCHLTLRLNWLVWLRRLVLC